MSGRVDAAYWLALTDEDWIALDWDSLTEDEAETAREVLRTRRKARRAARWDALTDDERTAAVRARHEKRRVERERGGQETTRARAVAPSGSGHLAAVGGHLAGVGRVGWGYVTSDGQWDYGTGYWSRGGSKPAVRRTADDGAIKAAHLLPRVRPLVLLTDSARVEQSRLSAGLSPAVRVLDGNTNGMILAARWLAWLGCQRHAPGVWFNHRATARMLRELLTAARPDVMFLRMVGSGETPRGTDTRQPPTEHIRPRKPDTPLAHRSGALSTAAGEGVNDPELMQHLAKRSLLGARVDLTRCPQCGKNSYPSEADAQRHARDRARQLDRALRVYACPDGCGFHLTKKVDAAL